YAFLFLEHNTAFYFRLSHLGWDICKRNSTTPRGISWAPKNLLDACRIPLFTIDKKSFSYLF
ncbi:hypothetical protein, partial [Escherichia coli]|uniref:hypothetical protein n=1 Tax=Escherichia coli TaxID=562 RepID=UPI00197ACCCF